MSFRIDLKKRKQEFGSVISELSTNLSNIYKADERYARNKDFEQVAPFVNQQQIVEHKVEEKPAEQPVVILQPVIIQPVQQKQQQIQTNQALPKQTAYTSSWKPAETKHRLTLDNSTTKFAFARHRISALQTKYAEDITWWEETFFGIFKYLFSSKYETKQAKHGEMDLLMLCTDFVALTIAANNALQKPLVTRGFFSKSEKLLNTIANDSDKLLPSVEEEAAEKEQPSYACTYETPYVSRLDF